MSSLVESMFVYQGLRAASVMNEEEGGRGDIHKITAAAVMFRAASQAARQS